tara:strand:- start:10 stop:282 length:273 start_codon:yes stop_codon:yes gene_type:complete
VSNQRKEMNVNEARDYVQSKTADAAKKAALAGTLFAVEKIPGSEKVKDLFAPTITKIKEKIPKGLNVNIDPFEKKAFIGLTIPFGGKKRN